MVVVAVEHKKLKGGQWSSACVMPCGSAIFVHWHSDVAVCFWYKMAGCTGSEFSVTVVGLSCLKMLWNKYTKSCIHT